VEDAEILLTAYGIMARIAKAAVQQARAEGLRVGLIRPITLYPFPVAEFRKVAGHAKLILCAELSTGQMIDDVRLAVEGKIPVELFKRCGGNHPTAEDLVAAIHALVGRKELVHA
jgi:pyruvate/2-oxoacid:ferredoxin oxidoreductase alpha subunit